ncbi:hypothetical protein F4806DRAFT_495824 [Annulohypoxylon nitens]|nr:hypothetical protein F4806DRAFT_495824 [Annulohypoxylon nitens]
METLSVLALRLLCAGLILADLCESSSFKPNCTLPTNTVNYVSGPNTRSTLSIVWNCTSVIILCTWSIQHLNVPAIHHSNKFMKKICISIQDSVTKVKWMVLTILVPEYIVGKALNMFLSARKMESKMRAENNIVTEEWGLVHSYLANMGYFVLDTEPYNEGQESKQTVPANKEHQAKKAAPRQNESRGAGEFDFITGIQRDMLNHRRSDGRGINLGHADAMVLRVRQFMTHDSDSPSTTMNMRRLQHRYWALNSRQWLDLFAHRLVKVPNIPTAYLERLDRGGMVVKLLAIFQVLYLIIQLISRKIQGLPSSQLEIATLAFSVSSLVTYCLYWNHPQGVTTIHIIPGKGVKSMKEEMAKLGPVYLWHKPRMESKAKPDLGPIPIPNDAGHDFEVQLPGFLKFLFGSVDRELLIWAFGSVFSGIPFGGLHCLAWNFEFPTRVELITWRVCSLATTALPLVIMVPIILRAKASNSGFSVPIFIILIMYILARLFLLAEMIRSLFYLPPRVFIDTWSNGIPHWG